MAEAFKKIFQGGIQRRPFKAYKRYEVTDVNYSSSFEISILRGISPNGLLTEVSKSVNGENVYDPSLLRGLGGATTELNVIPQKIIWRSVNSSLYKYERRLLHPTASIFSIPQNKFGNGIKPGSVVVIDNSSTDDSYFRLTDTELEYGIGVLRDTAISSSYIVNKQNIFYLGFQDGTHGKRFRKSTDDSTFQNTIIPSGLTIKAGIDTSGVVTSSGYSVGTFNSSSLIVYNTEQFKNINKVDDWAISMWAKLPKSQSYTTDGYNTFINKNQYEYTTLTDSRRIKRTPAYPIDMGVYNHNSAYTNGKVYYKVSDGLTTLHLTSSATYSDNNWHHYAVRKSGSRFDLFVDGESVSNGSPTFKGNINNYYDFLIASNKLGVTGTTGSFDEIRMYKGTLSDTDIFNLSNNHYTSGSAYQTRDVGYVYYKQGMIVVSDPRPKYQNAFLGNGNWDYSSNRGFQVDFRASKEVEEVSILCEIGRNEYNVSTNPSLRFNEDLNEERLKPMVTGSAFRPYITQVGLYNDFGDLLAIAKLGSPLKKRNDVDVTINVKFDID